MSTRGPEDEREKGFTVRDRRHWMQDEQATESVERVSEPESFAKPSYVQELEQKLATKEKELRDLVATYKRDVTQTVEETKARLRRDADKQLEIERLRLIDMLLPVLDNLTLAIAAARAHGGDPKLVQGVELVERQFLEKLASLGVEKFAAVGARFDPNLHEAVSTAPAPAEQDGVVVSELRPGYRLGERVVRPAMVQVGRAG